MVAIHASVQQSSDQLSTIRKRNLHRKLLIARESNRDQIVSLLQSLFEFVTQTDVHCKLWANAKIVLYVTCIVVDVKIIRGRDRNVSACRKSEQKARNCIAGVGGCAVGVGALGKAPGEREETTGLPSG